MVCLSCTGTGERVCLSAEGFGNRQCFLESIADKVGFIIKHLDTGHILHIPQQKSYTFTTHTAKCSVFFSGENEKNTNNRTHYLFQNVPPDLSQCVFVIEQALSVRALQEIISSNDAEAVS